MSKNPGKQENRRGFANAKFLEGHFAELSKGIGKGPRGKVAKETGITIKVTT